MRSDLECYDSNNDSSSKENGSLKKPNDAPYFRPLLVSAKRIRNDGKRN